MSEEDRIAEKIRIISQSPKNGEFWIFGFGSLMWRPGVEVADKQPATLHGYERKFEIWSTIGRGTLEFPGLGCCLVPGEGLCRGMAYSLAMDTLDADLDYLWNREMGSGVYLPTWVELILENKSRKMALTFVIREGHVQHAGPMPPEHMAEIIGKAEGENGKCKDYLENTLREMARLGERDELLEKVMSLIKLAEQREH